MMKKSSAGAWHFVAGVLFCCGFGLLLSPVATAQEVATSPEVVAATDAAPAIPPPSFSSPREKTFARLQEARDLPLDELKEILAKTEASFPSLSAQMGDLSRSADEARRTSSENSPEIQDLYRQIRALHDKIAALTETLPEVKEKTSAEGDVRSDLLGEMAFRTALQGLIRQKEAAEAAKAAQPTPEALP